MIPKRTGKQIKSMNSTNKLDEPYFIEVDNNGCTCGSGRTWTIIDPDGVATGQSWGDEDEAAYICELINDAYHRGQANVAVSPVSNNPKEDAFYEKAEASVGRAKWNFGSYYIWGDVPALMPITQPRRKSKIGSWDPTRENYNANHNWDGVKAGDRNKAAAEGGHKWSTSFDETLNGHKVPGFRFDGSGRSFQTAAVKIEGFKTQGMNWSDQTKRGQDFTRIAGKQAEGVKGSNGYEREHPSSFGWKKPGTSSKSNARKAASATIAKIPLALSLWIGKVYKP